MKYYFYLPILFISAQMYVSMYSSFTSDKNQIERKPASVTSLSRTQQLIKCLKNF